MEGITFYPQGDRAVTVRFGTEINEDIHENVMKLTNLLKQEPFSGMEEVVPSYHTVTVYYHPTRLSKTSLHPYEQIISILKQKLISSPRITLQNSTIITIPICYGGNYGPDLATVANFHQLSETDIIEYHLNQTYKVYMIGFVPGFPYLGGMDKRIATPRKETPRMAVPNGSVGIGGEQTGIYPIESPGGWQIIGRTPLHLFKATNIRPSILKAGDIVQFKQISEIEYENWDGASTCI
ncbi:5-oxoprolinase subunit PxpB [Metabacillus malikii]|uniref:Inhibitor of KinA n=1 Tax=Metabacillus malikii TaxID=1504265 RepID=A0ABT9ZES2_9BACI|nr:5-oxoprolinase subunit PxpB [Metabacillus malikii]MDQ0230770.1 inhibitor of KinA [Metabacillus malikii]